MNGFILVFILINSLVCLFVCFPIHLSFIQLNIADLSIFIVPVSVYYNSPFEPSFLPSTFSFFLSFSFSPFFSSLVCLEIIVSLAFRSRMSWQNGLERSISFQVWAIDDRKLFYIPSIPLIYCTYIQIKFKSRSSSKKHRISDPYLPEDVGLFPMRKEMRR